MGTYEPVVNWISVRSLLSIASINKLPSRSIKLVIEFTQYDLDVDVFMEISLCMGFDINKR